MIRRIFFFVFVMPPCVIAQTWPELGAKWTYCTGDILVASSADTDVIYYTRDTVIGGITYNVSEPELFSTNPYNTYLTRYSNDSVYRWVNDSEYLFFHFQLHLNEVITTFRSVAGSSDTTCSSLLALNVIDSSTVILGGQSVTRWILRDTIGFDPTESGSPDYPEFLLYEKFGPSGFPWFWNPLEEGCTWISDIGFSYLDGYDDDVVAEWADDCPMASLKEKNTKDQIIVYPNPVSNDFNIALGANCESVVVSIISVEGRVLDRLHLEEISEIKSISMPFSSGVYFLLITTDSEEKALIKLLKR